MISKKTFISLLLLFALVFSLIGKDIVYADDSSDTPHYGELRFEDELLISTSYDHVEQFVARLYQLVLGRSADAEGLRNWSNLLRRGVVTGASTAYEFVFSPEMSFRRLTDDRFIDVLYESMLGRKADIHGKTDWVNALNDGWSREDIFASFVNSVEFEIMCRQAGIYRGTYTPPPGASARVFVARLYRTVLERPPDTRGLDDWTNALRSGIVTGTSIAYEFVFSPEMSFRNLSDEHFIEVLYKSMLGRNADAQGKADWVNVLRIGVSRYRVFVGFVNSIEFGLICDSLGILRGTAPPHPGEERIFFGQLHSHSNLSDGIGPVENAYIYARDVAGLDFFAITDHCEYFDKTDSFGLNPAHINLDTHNAASGMWRRGQAAAAAAFIEGSFISFYGYEITWPNVVGHINTFNTGGFISAQNTTLSVLNDFTGLRAYYDLLKRTPNSISMFNHPNLVDNIAVYGNFNNFAYYDPVLNQRITLIEVGNGEGPLDSYYWRLYDQYILALDKGWKLAPTNNQDNHRGHWGNSNSVRTAIWTHDFSLDGVFKALREMRVYATEVSDLEIVYKVNGQPLGSTISTIPQTANFTAEIRNPTSGNFIKTVEILTNGGRRILTETPNAPNYNYNKTLQNPGAGYYFLWVVVGTPQGDRIAVTAPVWLG